MYPFKLSNINGSYTCYIFPKDSFSNGLYLTYETCPEEYDNRTSILVSYCCFSIIIQSIQHSYYKSIQDWLLFNSSTLLLLPALFFNIISLVVLNRFQRNTRNNQRTSTTFYMKCICLFDTFTIIAKFLNEQIVVGNGARKSPILITSSVCKSLAFLESVCAIISIYLLIAMTFDKLICVIAPLKVNQLLTNRHARYTFGYIVIFAIGLSSYYIVDRRVYILESSNDQDDLGFNETKLNFSNSSSNISNSTNRYQISYDCDSSWPERHKDWVIVENLIRVFLPIFSLVFCNIWIVVALRKAKLHTDSLFTHASTPPPIIITDDAEMNDDSDEKSNNTHIHTLKHRQHQSRSRSNSKLSTESDLQLKPMIANKKNSDGSISGTFILRAHRGGGGVGASSKVQFNRHNRSNNQHVSIMLFTVSIGFVLLNLPFALRTIIDRQYREKSKILMMIYHTDNILATPTSKSAIREAVIYEFFSTLTFLLQDLNYISNFFFYFFSGSRFREQLALLLRCEKANQINHNRQNSVYRNKFNNTLGNCSGPSISASNTIELKDLKSQIQIAPPTLNNTNMNSNKKPLFNRIISVFRFKKK